MSKAKLDHEAMEEHIWCYDICDIARLEKSLLEKWSSG